MLLRAQHHRVLRRAFKMLYLVYLALLDTIECSCVERSPEYVGIVGGKEIDIKEAPYRVSLRLMGQHFCGGSVVDNDIIITAAHCLNKLNITDEFLVRAGSTYHAEGGQLRGIVKCISNPAFVNFDYDVGILRLADPLTYSDFVKPIDMANADDEIPDGGKCTVTGWGYLKEKGNGVVDVLRGVMIPKINDNECYNSFKDLSEVTERTMCAGVPEGGKSSRYGDSGGPLVYNNKLHGIVSWSKGCARPGYPTVFSRVSALRGWIDETIAKLKAEDINEN